MMTKRQTTKTKLGLFTLVAFLAISQSCDLLPMPDTAFYDTVHGPVGTIAALTPLDLKIQDSNDIVLNWYDTSRAQSYMVQVSELEDFSTLVTSASGLTECTYSYTLTQRYPLLYWRPGAIDPYTGEARWGSARRIAFYTPLQAEGFETGPISNEWIAVNGAEISRSTNPVRSGQYSLNATLDSSNEGLLRTFSVETDGVLSIGIYSSSSYIKVLLDGEGVLASLSNYNNKWGLLTIPISAGTHELLFIRGNNTSSTYYLNIDDIQFLPSLSSIVEDFEVSSTLPEGFYAARGTVQTTTAEASSGSRSLTLSGSYPTLKVYVDLEEGGLFAFDYKNTSSSSSSSYYYQLDDNPRVSLPPGTGWQTIPYELTAGRHSITIYSTSSSANMVCLDNFRELAYATTLEQDFETGTGLPDGFYSLCGTIQTTTAEASNGSRSIELNGVEPTFQIYVDVEEAGLFAFDYKHTGSSSYYYMIDDNPEVSLSSGTGWQTIPYELTAGRHSITIYSTSSSANMVCLDNFRELAYATSLEQDFEIGPDLPDGFCVTRGTVQTTTEDAISGSRSIAMSGEYPTLQINVDLVESGLLAFDYKHTGSSSYYYQIDDNNRVSLPNGTGLQTIPYELAAGSHLIKIYSISSSASSVYVDNFRELVYSATLESDFELGTELPEGFISTNSGFPLTIDAETASTGTQSLKFTSANYRGSRLNIPINLSELKTLYFDIKLSTTWGDMYVYVDGVQVLSFDDSTEWTTCSIIIPSGAHSISFHLSSYSSTTAWIDNLHYYSQDIPVSLTQDFEDAPDLSSLFPLECTNATIISSDASSGSHSLQIGGNAKGRCDMPISVENDTLFLFDYKSASSYGLNVYLDGSKVANTGGAWKTYSLSIPAGEHILSFRTYYSFYSVLLDNFRSLEAVSGTDYIEDFEDTMLPDYLECSPETIEISDARAYSGTRSLMLSGMTGTYVRFLLNLEQSDIFSFFASGSSSNQHYFVEIDGISTLVYGNTAWVLYSKELDAGLHHIIIRKNVEYADEQLFLDGFNVGSLPPPIPTPAPTPPPAINAENFEALTAVPELISSAQMDLSIAMDTGFNSQRSLRMYSNSTSYTRQITFPVYLQSFGTLSFDASLQSGENLRVYIGDTMYSSTSSKGWQNYSYFLGKGLYTIKIEVYNSDYRNPTKTAYLDNIMVQ